jgi:hypothetical protein
MSTIKFIQHWERKRRRKRDGEGNRDTDREKDNRYTIKGDIVKKEKDSQTRLKRKPERGKRFLFKGYARYKK